MQKDIYIDAQINSLPVQDAAPVGINEERLSSTKQAATGKYRLESWLLCIAMGLAVLFLDSVLRLDGLCESTEHLRAITHLKKGHLGPLQYKEHKTTNT